ncbi:Protein RCOR-1 a [Aphelenchoides avenae]|nr:Protein RCOR-1 a [Aphelenchus avenae]
MKCDYDIEEAKRQVDQRRCLDEEWTDEDKEIFRNTFPVFKKDFHRLAKMFPDKAIYQVVEYYYNTKREEHYRDYIDPDVDVDSLTSEEEDKKAIDEKDMRHSGVCENCGMIVPKVYAVHEMEVCRTCKAYFRVTNQHRPCRRPEKLPRRVMCPSDMTDVAEQFIMMSEPVEAERFAAADEDDEIQVEEKPRTLALVAIDETKNNIVEQKKHAEAYRVVVDKEHTVLKKDVSVSNDARQFLASVSSGNADHTQRARMAYSWTKYEKEAAFHCLVSYPRDFEIASQIVKTKSPEMIKSFYYEHSEKIDEKIASTRRKLEEEIAGNDLDADLVALAQSAPAEVIDLE